MLRDMVSHLGYRAELANSGAAALAFLRRHQVQMLISEMRSRDIDGWDLLANFKKNDQGTHVVFLLPTITSDVEAILTSRDVDTYLLKPVESRRLEIILRALLVPGNLDRAADAYVYEPDEGTRAVIDFALSQAGICAELFDDPRPLEAVMVQDPPHLAIVDIGPSSPRGLAVCDTIRRLTLAYVPILAVADSVSRDMLARAARLNVNDLLLKPINTEELKERAYKLIGRTKRARR